MMIRMTLARRASEGEAMYYVGATQNHIRRPLPPRLRYGLVYKHKLFHVPKRVCQIFPCSGIVHFTEERFARGAL